MEEDMGTVTVRSRSVRPSDGSNHSVPVFSAYAVGNVTANALGAVALRRVVPSGARASMREVDVAAATIMWLNMAAGLSPPVLQWRTLKGNSATSPAW